LAQAHGQIPTQLGGDKDHGQGENHRGHRISVPGTWRGEGCGWHQGQEQKETSVQPTFEH
jgi:hypothetical protein